LGASRFPVLIRFTAASKVRFGFIQLLILCFPASESAFGFIFVSNLALASLLLIYFCVRALALRQHQLALASSDNFARAFASFLLLICF
jgi:hypothetical protein